MSRHLLIGVSLFADVLDWFIAGQIPVLSWIIDIPTVLMHVAFAGPGGYFTLIELIPVVGTLPLFTFAAIVQKPTEEES